MGSQPSATSAVISTFFGPSDATQMGMDGRTGWVSSLSGLPSPVPCPGGSGSWYRPSLVRTSRRHTRRQMSMISRVRSSGRS